MLFHFAPPTFNRCRSSSGQKLESVGAAILNYRPLERSHRPNAKDLANAKCGDLSTIETLLGNHRFRQLLQTHGIFWHQCKQQESILQSRTTGFRLEYPDPWSGSLTTQDEHEIDITSIETSVSSTLQRCSTASTLKAAKKGYKRACEMFVKLTKCYP